MFNKLKPLIGVSSRHNCFSDPEIRDTYEVKTDYIDCIIAAGGIPMIIPCIEDKKILDLYLGQVEAMLFTGGPDWPAEFYNEENSPENKSYSRIKAESDFYLMRRTLENQLPILGICAGAQLLNIVCGGKLIQHLENSELHSNYRATHKIRVSTHSVLMHEIARTEELTVNTEHHQAVCPENIGNNLQIAAIAEDGTIEAIEGTGKVFHLGVQFHPERANCGSIRNKIFNALINAARNISAE